MAFRKDLINIVSRGFFILHIVMNINELINAITN